MAKIRNVSGQDLLDSYANRLVLAGAVVEVPDEVLWNYTQRAPGQTNHLWEPADKASKAAFDKAFGKRYPNDDPGAPAVADDDGKES